MKLLTPQEFLPFAYEIAFEAIRTFIECSCSYIEILGQDDKKETWYDFAKLNQNSINDEDLIALDLQLLSKYKNFMQSQLNLKHLNFIPKCNFILKNNEQQTLVRFL
jgi:hypothetical protein